MTAEQYLNSLPAAQQQQVRQSLASSGSSVEQWFQAAVDAGDPSAVRAAGGTSTEGGWNDDGSAMGVMASTEGAAPASAWMGKRAPTPRELRAYGQQQHAAYLSGDRTAQDEDYARFDDRALAKWIKDKWDVQKGGFFGPAGEKLGKPVDTDSSGKNAYGEAPSGPAQGGGGGGGQAQAAPAPVAPTTFGNQLSMTGNPMQDMLINQFNTGQNATYAQGNNIFGLGEDRKMGGTGANADVQAQNKAQSLSGGGLWWGQSDGKAPDTFQGFRADQKNTTAPATTIGGVAAAAGGGRAPAGACPPGQTKNAKGQCVSKAAARSNENSIAGMASSQYSAGGA